MERLERKEFQEGTESYLHSASAAPRPGMNTLLLMCRRVNSLANPSSPISILCNKGGGSDKSGIKYVLTVMPII